MTSSHPVLSLFHIRYHHSRLRNFLFRIPLPQFLPQFQSNASTPPLVTFLFSFTPIICWNICSTLFLPLTNDNQHCRIHLLIFSSYIISHSYRFSLSPTISAYTTLNFPSSFQLSTQNNVRITHNSLSTHTHTYINTIIYFKIENQRIIFLYLRNVLLNVAFIIVLN